MKLIMHKQRLLITISALVIASVLLLGSNNFARSASLIATTSTASVQDYPPITAQNASQLVEIAQSEGELEGEWEWLLDGRSILTETGILEFDGTTLRHVRDFPAPFLQQFKHEPANSPITRHISASGTMILGFRTDEATDSAQTVYLWRPLERDELIAVHPFATTHASNQLAGISPDGKLLLVNQFNAPRSREIRVWDVERDKLVMTVAANDLTPDAALFSPDSSIVAITFLDLANVGRKDQVRLYETNTGRELFRLEDGPYYDLFYANAEISSDNRYVALYARGRDDRVLVWELSSGHLLQYPLPATDRELARGFAFSPDASLLIVPTLKGHQYYANGNLRVLELATQQTVAELPAKMFFPARSVRFSPDGRWLALEIFKDDNPLHGIIYSWWAVDSDGSHIAATQTLLPLTATADAFTPTSTATATWTPTPIAPTNTTKLKVDDTAYVISRSPFAGASLLEQPGRTAKGVQTCAPGTRVTVLAVSQNAEDAASTLIYYEIECTGKRGWLAEYNLTAFASGDHVTVRTTTGEPAAMYARADASTKLASGCEHGTATSVHQVSQSPKPDLDPVIYVRITCDGTTGYIVDTDLVKTDK